MEYQVQHTSTCSRNRSVTLIPSKPPAHDPSISRILCASLASSSYVGTYGGLKTIKSTACLNRVCKGEAKLTRIGSMGTCFPWELVLLSEWIDNAPCFETLWRAYNDRHGGLYPSIDILRELVEFMEWFTILHRRTWRWTKYTTYEAKYTSWSRPRGLTTSINMVI